MVIRPYSAILDFGCLKCNLVKMENKRQTDKIKSGQKEVAPEAGGTGLEPASLTRQLLGGLCIFASAFFFYMATVVIRWAKDVTVLDPSFFVFARFLLGFAVICLVMLIRRQGPNPRRYHLLVGRTVTNFLAVYFFFQSVTVTSVAEGNILNMTYPVFLALFSWVILKHQRDVVAVVMVFLAFAGIWLILVPSVGLSVRVENLWGLASGVSAAASMVYLNMSRQYHDSETVLFYMFGLGTVLTYVLFFPHIRVPDGTEFGYLFLCAFFGVGGQYLLTIGFRFVTAVEGGIISSTRILLAAMLGPVLADEAPLGGAGWAGALLIFTANVVLATRKAIDGERTVRG